MGLNSVIGPGEASDRVQQDHYIALVLHHSFGFFDHHFGDLNMPLRWLVEGGTDDFGSTTSALHVRDFLGALVDEQNEKVSLRIVTEDCVGQLLHEDRFTGPRGSDNQPAGSFSDGTHKVEDPSGKLIGSCFENKTLV